MDETKPAQKLRWPLWLGLFVLVGSIVTAFSAFYVSFWG
jgi:hypothetical protein